MFHATRLTSNLCACSYLGLGQPASPPQPPTPWRRGGSPARRASFTSEASLSLLALEGTRLPPASTGSLSQAALADFIA